MQKCCRWSLGGGRMLTMVSDKGSSPSCVTHAWIVVVAARRVKAELLESFKQLEDVVNAGREKVQNELKRQQVRGHSSNGLPLAHRMHFHFHHDWQRVRDTNFAAFTSSLHNLRKEFSEWVEARSEYETRCLTREQVRWQTLFPAEPNISRPLTSFPCCFVGLPWWCIHAMPGHH